MDNALQTLSTQYAAQKKQPKSYLDYMKMYGKEAADGLFMGGKSIGSAVGSYANKPFYGTDSITADIAKLPGMAGNMLSGSDPAAIAKNVANSYAQTGQDAVSNYSQGIMGNVLGRMKQDVGMTNRANQQLRDATLGAGSLALDTADLFPAAIGVGGAIKGLSSLARKTNPPLTAYHGSPHSFDKFQTSEIGTGEGAQVYGDGLYFAEREGVAKSYKDELTRPRYELQGKTVDKVYTQELREAWPNIYDDLKDDVAINEWKLDYLDDIESQGGNVDKASPILDDLVDKVFEGTDTTYDFDRLDEFNSGRDLNDLYDFTAKQGVMDSVLANMGQVDNPQDLEHVLNGFNGEEMRLYRSMIKDKVQHVTPEGSMYKVELGVDKDMLLDWDKPLAYQPQGVKEAYGRAYKKQLKHPELMDELHDGAWNPTNSEMGLFDKSGGGQAYNTLKGEMFGRDAKKTSQALKEQGIPGIKYLDGGSRQAGEGSSNYVMFDQETIKILKKYGILAPTFGAGAMASQEDPWAIPTGKN